MVGDVAGGTGLLSYYLAQEGYNTTVIDPRHTDLPRPERVKAQHQQLPIQRQVSRISGKDYDRFDLLVGLHPDVATRGLAWAARKLPVVIVPCCLLGWQGQGRNRVEDRIRSIWSSLRVRWEETQLQFRGKNLLLVARAR